MKKFLLVLGLTAAVAMLAVIPGALGRSSATPGVTATGVKIGSTLPLSGPAALYARIGTGMKAYFSYINARKSKVDGKRGVYGRQIMLNIYDDGYSQANTVQQTRRAVEQDDVFAMLGGLGTENQLAVRDYLNQKKVPQLYVSTGLAGFGDDQGVPVDDRLAAGLRPGGHPARQVHQGEHPEREDRRPLPERRLRQGVAHGLPEGRRRRGRSSRRAATRATAVPRRPPLIPQLKASGADTLLVFATPTESITALAVA